MSLQSSITEFFPSRKRPAVDDSKTISQPSKKVMIMKNEVDVSECPKFNTREEDLVSLTRPTVRKKLIYSDKRNQIASIKETLIRSRKESIEKQKSRNSEKTITPIGIKQLDIRDTFNVIKRTNSSTLKEDLSSEDLIFQESSVSSPKKNVSFGIMEGLTHTEKTENFSRLNDGDKKSTKEDFKKSEELKKNKISKETSKSVQELSLGELKDKLKQQNSRCDELKSILNRLNKGFANLEKHREKRLAVQKPSLKQFDTVTFEVDSSLPKTPVKVPGVASPISSEDIMFRSPSYSANMESNTTPVKISTSMSPAKLRESVFKSPGQTLNMQPSYVSPRKLFNEQPEQNTLTSPSKPRAFQRYLSLISEGRSALPLPFKFRSLAEIFRGMETVVSMMYNRGETITFTKLKSATQELLRRNLYEKHLGQIKTVYKDAYDYAYQKVSISKLQPDKYELVITPVLGDSNSRNVDENTPSEKTYQPKMEMTPDLLLTRRRHFYNCLLEKTKIFHEAFLSCLDPPLHVPRESLTRWHPDFDVDGVPDIEPATLPLPPHEIKVASAQDVLEKARYLFGSSPRLETAMHKKTELNSTKGVVRTLSAGSNTGPAVHALSNALRGIPKSLLEKVKAKQAAKALEAMTRSPSQAKEAVMLTRLPEMARIVRNIFISEKKSVLTRELVLKKLSDSCRENLSFCDLNEHLNLLREKTPEWLSFCTLRKTNFVRFVKDADMSRVMAQLKVFALDNSY